MFRKTFVPALLAAVTLAGCHRGTPDLVAPPPTSTKLAASPDQVTASTQGTFSSVPMSPTTITAPILPCDFRATPVAPPARPVTPPPNGAAPTDPDVVNAVIKTSEGDIPLALTPGKTPCTVLNFLSLAQQHFYDNTSCHRLTTDGIFVLQCGDPTGSGSGGPGYSFADEYPIGSRVIPPQKNSDTLYSRGTLAMANSGPDTNGSQFFLVIQDSPLPPHYTIFGSTDDTGLSTLDKIAAGGVIPSPTSESDGEPKTPVQILSVQGP